MRINESTIVTDRYGCSAAAELDSLYVGDSRSSLRLRMFRLTADGGLGLAGVRH